MINKAINAGTYDLNPEEAKITRIVNIFSMMALITLILLGGLLVFIEQYFTGLLVSLSSTLYVLPMVLNHRGKRQAGTLLFLTLSYPILLLLPISFGWESYIQLFYFPSIATPLILLKTQKIKWFFASLPLILWLVCKWYLVYNNALIGISEEYISIVSTTNVLLAFAFAIVIFSSFISENEKLNFSLKLKNEELLASEEELRAINNQLDQNNLLLQHEQGIALITQYIAQIGYWEINTDLNTVILTKQVRELFNIKESNEISQSDFFNMFSGSSVDLLKERFQSIVNDETEFDERVERVEGDRYFFYRIVGKVDKNGSQVSYYGTIQDVTKQKEQEDKLRAGEQLRQEIAYKSEFLAQMAHEIRTPMNGVVGMLDLLETEGNLNDNQIERLELIKSSSGSLISIIEDVLTVSNHEIGKSKVNFSEFELESLVLKNISLFEPSLARNVQLKYFISDDVPAYVVLDKSKISQILRNLLSNAVKYTDKGRIDLIVSVSEGNSLRFEVKDSGKGIREEDQRDLFQMFHQSKETKERKVDGTEMGVGLGLSICKKHVELLQGKIGMESVLNEGSSFWFEVPFKASDKSKTKIETGDRLRFKLRVLIVEDKLVNQQVAKLLLKELGCETATAENGQIALDMLNNGERFDLILMDIQMPVMDGLTATTEIRKMDFNEVLKVIALSATIPEVEDYLEKNQLDDFISKPVNLEILSEYLRKHFQPYQ